MRSIFRRFRSALQRLWATVAESGFHHLILSLTAVPLAFAHVVAWLVGVTFWNGLYFEREEVYQKVRGIKTGGRYRDWVFVAIHWVVALLVTLFTHAL